MKDAQLLMFLITIGLSAGAVLTAESSVDPDCDADISIANAYDDNWKSDWISHFKEVLKRSKNKTPGFVIHIGDSITYSPEYGTLSRNHHSTDEFGKALDWSKGGGTDDYSDVKPDCKNGWSLANARRSIHRASYTAVSGITDEQWLRGGSINKGETHFASGKDDPSPLDTLLNNNSVEPHPGGNTVALVQDAQICVLMLGTNNLWGGALSKERIDKIRANLETIVQKLEAKDIMTIISTVPPFADNAAGVESLNAVIREIAKEKRLPLIDFHSEIIRRAPGDSWKGTILGGDNVHPSGGAYQDPFKKPDVFKTNGYLLRAFLSVCKIMEVKRYVMDGTPYSGGGKKLGDSVSFTTDSLPDAVIGVDYEQMVAVEPANPKHAFYAYGLPAGMKMSKTGTITGKAKKAGDYEVTIKVDPSGGSAVRHKFNLKVIAASENPVATEGVDGKNEK